MRQPYLVVGALIGLLSGAGAVMAQTDPGRIPGPVVGAQNALNDKDQQVVISYIDYWVKQLQSGKPEAIATARGRLTEAYNQGGTEVFVTFYDQSLATRIGAGLGAKDVAGRMNTLLVAKLIRHERVIDVIKAGLKEQAAAVAYQAAVAAKALVDNPKVANAVKFGLRGPVAEALKKENSAFVLPYLYGALIAIDDVAGWDAVLAKINDRLAAHYASDTAGLDAEVDGLRVLSDRLINLFASPSAELKVPDKTLHMFSLVCVRYLELALSATTPNAALVNLCDTRLQWAARQLKVTAPAAINNKTVDEQKLGLSDWKRLLKGDPFKFADADINKPVKK